MLEANPELTARDVRRILGLTAQKNDPSQAYLPWFLNGASKTEPSNFFQNLMWWQDHWVSYNYGFGLVNVDRAVAAAKMWTTALPASTAQPTGKHVRVLLLHN